MAIFECKCSGKLSSTSLKFAARSDNLLAQIISCVNESSDVDVSAKCEAGALVKNDIEDAAKDCCEVSSSDNWNRGRSNMRMIIESSDNMYMYSRSR